MRQLHIVFLALVLFAWSFWANAGQNYCREVAFSDEPVCTVSQLRMLIEPEDYDGKLVIFSSFLKLMESPPHVLYASTESAERELRVDAILLDAPNAFLEEKGVKTGVWIRVYGRFKINDSPLGQSGVGSIEQVLEVFPEKLQSPELVPKSDLD